MRRATAIGLLLFLCARSAHAAGVETAGSKPHERVLGIGPSYGRFARTPYYALAIDASVGIPFRTTSNVRPIGVGEVSIGQGPHAGLMPIVYAGLGVGTFGWVRASLSLRASWAIGLHASKANDVGPFSVGSVVWAQAGRIGSFGLGCAVQLGVDIVRTERFAIGPALKVSGDAYDGGEAFHGAALIESAF